MANESDDPWDGGLTVCGSNASQAEPIRIDTADVLACLGWSREDRGQYDGLVGRINSVRERSEHRCSNQGR